MTQEGLLQALAQQQQQQQQQQWAFLKRALNEQQQEHWAYVERTLKRWRESGSYQTPHSRGATLNGLLPDSEFWLHELPPLDVVVLQHLLVDADASTAWNLLQEQNRKARQDNTRLLEEHVQQCYIGVLQRLRELSTNPHGLHVVDTSQGALGYGRKKPDLAVSRSETALLAGTLYYVELEACCRQPAATNRPADVRRCCRATSPSLQSALQTTPWSCGI